MDVVRRRRARRVDGLMSGGNNRADVDALVDLLMGRDGADRLKLVVEELLNGDGASRDKEAERGPDL